MSYGVGASGYVGIGIETTSGTYAAPTYYFNLRGENMKYTPKMSQRRLLRGTPDVAGVLAGNAFVEGSIDVEVIEDGLVYLLKCARGTIVKTGSSTPWTYTFTPSNVAVPTATCSITVVRNGVAFGFVGCIVHNISFTTDDSVLVGSFDLLGINEANQSVPTAAFSSLQPYSAGKYSIEIPTATQVFDDVNFTLAINDNGSNEDRLKNTLGAQFTRYGERSVELSMQRDFQSRTEFDAFKALTAQSIRIKATKSSSQSVQFTLPVAVKDDYTISGLSGQADLIMADIKYIGTNTGAGPYDITIVSDVSITIP